MPKVSDEVNGKPPSVLARTVWARRLYLVLGTFLVFVGIVGLILPVMPGVIFLVGAAACYARGSERFYRWLVGHRWFGKMIRDFDRAGDKNQATVKYGFLAASAISCAAFIYLVAHRFLRH